MSVDEVQSDSLFVCEPGKEEILPIRLGTQHVCAATRQRVQVLVRENVNFLARKHAHLGTLQALREQPLQIRIYCAGQWHQLPHQRLQGRHLGTCSPEIAKKKAGEGERERGKKPVRLPQFYYLSMKRTSAVFPPARFRAPVTGGGGAAHLLSTQKKTLKT